MIICLL